MSKIRTLVCALVAVQLGVSGPARAGADPIGIEFDRGFVTIHASKASVAEILKQYGLVGNVEIRNLDVVPPKAVTLVLDRVPEAAALDILMRCCGGFIALSRVNSDQVQQSRFRRIVIFREGERSIAVSPPPVELPPPPVEPIEIAPGEVRPRLGPDGKPMTDDQQPAPQGH